MIKGGFFLKSLKQLFIISLISCFILLGSSFVNASCITQSSSNASYMVLCDNNGLSYFYDSNSYFVGGVYDYKFNLNDNIFKYDLPQRGNILNYWWGYGTLNYSVSNLYNSDDSKNGVINGFYYFIGAVGNDPTYTLNGRGYDFYTFDKLPNYLDDTYKFVDYYCAINKNNNFPYCIVCLTQGTNEGHICIDYSNSTLKSDEFIDIDQIESIATRNPFFKGGTSFSPSTGSRLGGRLITSSGYTNNQMIEAYQCVGLTPELCYGGFSINDIFEPSETFEDFTGYVAGQGATIFDLYNLYSSSFSNINQFLNTVLTRYQNGQINSFKTEPKALLMLGSQMNVAGFKTSYISTYCDLLLNKNNTSTYTGNSVDDLRAQSCYRSQHINDLLKNSDGSDVIGQGSNVGIFGSGDDVDFDPETFFSNMMEKISSGLDSVSVGTAVGVIPGYIILFTLALILIRLLSH